MRPAQSERNQSAIERHAVRDHKSNSSAGVPRSTAQHRRRPGVQESSGKVCALGPKSCACKTTLNSPESLLWIRRMLALTWQFHVAVHVSHSILATFRLQKRMPVRRRLREGGCHAAWDTHGSWLSSLCVVRAHDTQQYAKTIFLFSCTGCRDRFIFWWPAVRARPVAAQLGRHEVQPVL